MGTLRPAWTDNTVHFFFFWSLLLIIIGFFFAHGSCKRQSTMTGPQIKDRKYQATYSFNSILWDKNII